MREAVKTVLLFHAYNNKDHQRMTVDTIFMIVQSLGSFLTAVTPTAVTPNDDTPVAIILLEFPELTGIFLN